MSPKEVFLVLFWHRLYLFVVVSSFQHPNSSNTLVLVYPEQPLTVFEHTQKLATDQTTEEYLTGPC